jgi:hypothetical protein
MISKQIQKHERPDVEDSHPEFPNAMRERAEVHGVDAEGRTKDCARRHDFIHASIQQASKVEYRGRRHPVSRRQLDLLLDKLPEHAEEVIWKSVQIDMEFSFCSR